MTTTRYRRSPLRQTRPWQQFCQWITSTHNRLHIRWFGVLMTPTLWVATICNE